MKRNTLIHSFAIALFATTTQSALAQDNLFNRFNDRSHVEITVRDSQRPYQAPTQEPRTAAVQPDPFNRFNDRSDVQVTASDSQRPYQRRQSDERTVRQSSDPFNRFSDRSFNSLSTPVLDSQRPYQSNRFTSR
ncbi:MAG: hypothetical protein R3202_04155 [Candidatus Competibacterales bacterium]|nr:hypothetical protein [Candidatus Competibacterales bacterium]